MDETLTTAREQELEVNEDDIEELILGHEDELTTEELQEILNEEHQETQRNVSFSEQEENERGPMPTSAIKDLLKKWADVRAMVLECHPNQADVSRKLWKINKGKCGICGDAWDLPEPRPNEDGGKYGKGIVVRTYKAGQEFTSTVFIVANHEGYFEFKLCPVKPGVKIDQDCLDQHPVGLADGSGNRYILKRGIKGNLDIKLKLPNGLKCDRCVLQYHWKAANNWGICEDGKGRMGCGPQEYFRACADIRIE
ncbi:chitin-binding type-4 domain-containing protein [Trichonephila clavipes]|nr:chitin-binding type-4 domain-containing protein [Trichonephila clavipes]